MQHAMSLVAGGPALRSRLAAAAVLFLVLPSSYAPASGSWVIDSQADWLSGTVYRAEGLTSPGIVNIRRNVDGEFVGAPGGSLPAPWVSELWAGSVDRTSRPEYLRLHSGGVASQWLDMTDSAPKVFQPIDGDFRITTCIDYTLGAPQHNSSGACLFVRKDSQNCYALGFLATKTPSGTVYEAHVMTNGVSKSVAGPLPSGGKAWFRIERAGSVLRSWYSANGALWNSFPSGDMTVSWEVLAAGVYVYDEAPSPSSSADFEYVHFSTTGGGAASGIYYSKTFDLGVTPSAQGTIWWMAALPAGTDLRLCTRTSPDGAAWSEWSSPYALSTGSAIASPLNRYLQFSATLTENASLQSPSLDKVTITFPGIPPKSPVVRSTTNPDQGWGHGDPVQLAWIDPPDSPVPVWAYYYALNAPLISGTSVADSATILSASTQSLALGGLADGVHEFRIVAQGEPAEYPLSAEVLFVIRKDTVAPTEVAITSGTHPNANSSENNSPAFLLSATDPTTAAAFVSGIAGYHYVLDQAAGTAPGISDPFITGGAVQYSGLRNGSWWLHARAKDGAGNLGPAGHYQVTINFSGKILEASDVHAVPHPIRTMQATIQYDLRAPAQEIEFEFFDPAGRKVGNIPGPTSSGRNTVLWNTSGLANGVYFCKIRVRRQDGRQDSVMKKLAVVH